VIAQKKSQKYFHKKLLAIWLSEKSNILFLAIRGIPRSAFVTITDNAPKENYHHGKFG